MTTDYVERHNELKQGFKDLSRTTPGPMAGFATLHSSAMEDGHLPRSVKELMALVVGITGHCEGCIAFHVHDALRAGATREQVEEAIGVGIMMGGGPAAVYGVEALHAVDQFEARVRTG